MLVTKASQECYYFKTTHEMLILILTWIIQRDYIQWRMAKHESTKLTETAALTYYNTWNMKANCLHNKLLNNIVKINSNFLSNNKSLLFCLGVLTTFEISVVHRTCVHSSYRWRHKYEARKPTKGACLNREAWRRLQPPVDFG